MNEVSTACRVHVETRILRAFATCLRTIPDMSGMMISAISLYTLCLHYFAQDTILSCVIVKACRHISISRKYRSCAQFVVPALTMRVKGRIIEQLQLLLESFENR